VRSLEPFEIKCRDMEARYKIWGIGDVHLYNACCMEGRIKRLVKEISEDPYSYWVGLGDYADCIDFYDPRFDAREIAKTKRDAMFERMPKRLVEDITDLFSPIKKKCLGLCEGNHEDKFQQEYDVAVVKDVCDNLGCRFLGYSAIFDVAFNGKKNRVTRKMFVHHGAGASATTGGKINRLKKFMIEICDADIVMVGHSHERIDLQIVRLIQDAQYKLTEREIIGAISGSYLATYKQDQTSYAEKKGYSPVSIGSVAITIVPSLGWTGTERR